MSYYNYINDAADGKPVVRGSVLHSIYGACFANHLAKDTDLFSKLAAEMIRVSIMSHHGLRNTLAKDGTPAFSRAAERISDSYKQVEHIVYSPERTFDSFIVADETAAKNYLLVQSSKNGEKRRARVSLTAALDAE